MLYIVENMTNIILVSLSSLQENKQSPNYVRDCFGENPRNDYHNKTNV